MIDDYILGCVILIILVIFGIYITYTLYKNPDIAKIYLECPVGECATNIYNGEKRCPEDSGTIIIYDPSYEVCNSKYTCENSLTPYALLKNGETSDSGKCDDLEICRCLSKPSCSSNNIVLFSLKNGNTQIDGNSSRGIFYQIINSNQGNISSINYTNINTQFCLIKSYHLNRISPNPCYYKDINNITISDVSSCMLTNPCITGTLAFDPKNIDLFQLNENTVYTIPVGCFASEFKNCGEGRIAVYNNKTNKIDCMYF